MNLGLRKTLRNAVLGRPSLFKMVQIIKGEADKLLLLDYPSKFIPRYGYNRPSHKGILKLIRDDHPDYALTLKNFLRFKSQLLGIPLGQPRRKNEPYWINGWFGGLDFIALYALVGIHKPKTYLEVGAGLSTKLARRAISDNNLSTKIISIDPEPREKVDKICDKIIRKPLEDVDLKIFNDLGKNDILFIDGSHRCLMNSDVTVFFLDILPHLAPGVIVHLHDIFWPYDYPPEAVERYYSEQYLLGLYLLANPKRFKIILPNTYVGDNKKLLALLDPISSSSKLKTVKMKGASFWMRIERNR